MKEKQMHKLITITSHISQMQLRIYIVACCDPVNCVAAGHACKQDELKNTGIYEVLLPSIHSRGKV